MGIRSMAEGGVPNNFSRGYGGDTYAKFHNSAPGKMNLRNEKDKGKEQEKIQDMEEENTDTSKIASLEAEDAIPAATYEPSDCSGDFQLLHMSLVTSVETSMNRQIGCWGMMASPPRQPTFGWQDVTSLC